MINRAASLLVALGYIVAALVATKGHDESVLWLALVLLFPLALIWFPGVIGGYVGPWGGGGYVNRESPPFLIVFMGWFFLIGIPAILWLIWHYGG